MQYIPSPPSFLSLLDAIQAYNLLFFLQSWQFCYDMRGVSIPQHPTLLISALHWRKSTNPGAARASWATQPPCCLEKEKHVFSKYLERCYKCLLMEVSSKDSMPFQCTT